MKFVPQEGKRAYHQSRGSGTVTKVDDYQYCYFKPDNHDAICFVCKDNLASCKDDLVL